MQVPGEGGERPFRSRLSEAFLEKLLGWPPELILGGEKFDILLLNREGHPAVTIETKEPGHVTTEAEYDTFLNRLKHYASLREAYLTNGSYWERYEIAGPLAGEEEITPDGFEDIGAAQTPALFGELARRPKLGKRYELVLHKASVSEIEDFFAPLNPALYVDLTQPVEAGAFRLQLRRDQPQHIESFSASLRDHILDFQKIFFHLFGRYRGGELGAEVAKVCRGAFELWCARSYVVPPEKLLRRVERELAAHDISATRLARMLTTEFGFSSEQAPRVGEALFAERKRRASTTERRLEILWPLYESAILNFAAQTAHVYAARLLLYRIGEDQQVFPERISGDALKKILAGEEESGRIPLRAEPLSLVVIEALRAEMAEFAATVYESGEFDWWRVLHRAELGEAELQRLHQIEQGIHLANQRLLRLLASFDFSGMDLDIWRDVYQHYLPEEERQRLGGFYTPQELVDLTLDCADYRPETEKLCQQSLTDLASGSGAFVVSALQRLLAHFEDKSHACHASLHKRDLPDWEKAHTILQALASNIHAIDIHPFAAFLTYINFLFGVLPLYAAVRRHRGAFRLEAAVFSANSLLTPGENAGQRELDLPVNSRIQLTRYARERYRKMAAERFDYVVGNPPWGGILKGRLAPIFDEHYKTQLSKEYPDTYTGKLDIYGLFYDRALTILKSGGTVALVSQGSFIDKEWAGPRIEHVRGEPREVKGLRRKLAEQAALRYLIDFNPFGQLFFGAMNIPCIAVFEKRPAYDRENAVVVLSSKKSWPKALSKTDRRREVVSHVRRCLELVEKSGEPLKQDFVTAFPFPLSRLRDFGGSRWLLAPKEFKIHARPNWPRVAQLLEPSQGLTVGGEGCLAIFLMPESQAKELGLEKALVHRIIKGRQTTAWRLEWEGDVILYPYHKDKEGQWRPAFKCRKPPLFDALDFEHPADKFEEDWLRKYGRNHITYKRLFEHRRDELEIIKYPKAGEYLVKHYDQLSGRAFKKKNIRDFDREWYEFIWHRDPEVILTQPKIISPRLTPKVRFALDQEGLAIQDSCICLSVSDNTREAFREFRKQLSDLSGREVKTVTILGYLLAFLNSSYAQELLTTGHRPRPGDVFQVSDQFLDELSIPLPRNKRQLQSLLDAVDACMLARQADAIGAAQSRLNALVAAAYSTS
jgi:hypothetical protein